MEEKKGGEGKEKKKEESEKENERERNQMYFGVWVKVGEVMGSCE